MQRIEGKNEVSIYKGELTQAAALKATEVIKNAFPTLENGFYDVFFEMIKDEGFNDARLLDSVKHVIKNCIYPQPTIAQFLSYDKRIEVFTYQQMQDKTDTDKKAFDRFKAVKLTGMNKPMWSSLENIDLYNLELWKK